MAPHRPGPLGPTCLARPCWLGPVGPAKRNAQFIRRAIHCATRGTFTAPAHATASVRMPAPVCSGPIQDQSKTNPVPDTLNQRALNPISRVINPSKTPSIPEYTSASHGSQGDLNRLRQLLCIRGSGVRALNPVKTDVRSAYCLLDALRQTLISHATNSIIHMNGPGCQ